MGKSELGKSEMVDCAECQRGGNARKTCGWGWNISLPRLEGCFAGIKVVKV